MARSTQECRTVEHVKQEERVPAKDAGELLYAKHAFPPNNLGYCGPDARGKILDYLHGSSAESLLPFLTRFEAAYPFVKMIAKSTGMKPFDHRVTEAYWLGNSLLNQVPPPNFFEFTHKDLALSRGMAGKKGGMGKEEAKLLFRKLGSLAKPHHTFYVLNMYAKAGEKSESKEKLLQLLDSCRISWGKVLEVKRDTLIVERSSLVEMEDDRLLTLAPPKEKEVGYDPEIRPFNTIRRGDWVSLHWNFASEKLTSFQLRNLKYFTALDLKATNRSVATTSISF